MVLLSLPTHDLFTLPSLVRQFFSILTVKMLGSFVSVAVLASCVAAAALESRTSTALPYVDLGYTVQQATINVSSSPPIYIHPSICSID